MPGMLLCPAFAEYRPRAPYQSVRRRVIPPAASAEEVEAGWKALAGYFDSQEFALEDLPAMLAERYVRHLLLIEQELELFLQTVHKPSVVRRLRGRHPLQLFGLKVGAVQAMDDLLSFDFEASFLGDRDDYRLVRRSFDPKTVLTPFEMAVTPALFGSVFGRGLSMWRAKSGAWTLGCRLEAPLPLLEHLSLELAPSEELKAA